MPVNCYHPWLPGELLVCHAGNLSASTWCSYLDSVSSGLKSGGTKVLEGEHGNIWKGEKALCMDTPVLSASELLICKDLATF